MAEHYEAYFILPEAADGDTWECLNIGGPDIVGAVMFSAQQVVDMKADRDRYQRLYEAASRDAAALKHDYDLVQEDWQKGYDELAAQAEALTARVQRLERGLKRCCELLERGTDPGVLLAVAESALGDAAADSGSRVRMGELQDTPEAEERAP
jgi:hypothetical protein